MTATDELKVHQAGEASAKFFIRIGQVGRATEDHNETLHLFPLTLIMDCEMLLSRDARHLVDDGAEYLRKCRHLIATAALEMWE